jgi:hypothetical protein
MGDRRRVRDSADRDIARTNDGKAVVTLAIAGPRGGLMNEESEPQPACRGEVHEMDGADDIRDAVEDQLTFDPDVDAAELSAARLIGVRSVSIDIQIRAEADQPTPL